jgi:hypothetical protein
LDGLRKIFNRGSDVREPMARTRRTLLAALAAGASIAGCLGDDGDGDSDGDDGETGGDDGGSDGAGDSSGDDGGSDGGTSDESSDGGMGDDTATVATAEHGDLGEILVDFDRVDILCTDDFGGYGRVIPAPRSDFKNRITRCYREFIGHDPHHVRSTDGLVITDGERSICVRLVSFVFRNEFMAGNSSQRIQDGWVVNSRFESRNHVDPGTFEVN